MRAVQLNATWDPKPDFKLGHNQLLDMIIYMNFIGYF